MQQQQLLRLLRKEKYKRSDLSCCREFNNFTEKKHILLMLIVFNDLLERHYENHLIRMYQNLFYEQGLYTRFPKKKMHALVQVVNILTSYLFEVNL